MQLRERQYQSRLRSRVSGKQGERFSVTSGHQRPPLQVMKNVLKWAPIAIIGGIVWYLLDAYVF